MKSIICYKNKRRQGLKPCRRSNKKESVTQ